MPELSGEPHEGKEMRFEANQGNMTLGALLATAMPKLLNVS